MSRKKATFSSNSGKERSENFSFQPSGSDLEINDKIFRTAARSMKKKDGHAEISSCELRSLEVPWEALGSLSSKLAKQ